jgi:hypothetical protein
MDHFDARKKIYRAEQYPYKTYHVNIEGDP